MASELVSDLELAALSNEHGKFGLGGLRVRLDVLNFSENHERRRVKHLPKDNVLAVQPVALRTSKEKLAAVGVRSAVGHGEKARAVVAQNKIFVIEPL